MIILNVIDLNQYDIWFAGAPYTQGNSYAKTLREWCEQEKADLCFNLAFFNMGTASNKKAGVAYRTLEYVRGLKGDLGYGGTEEKLELPNGCKCSGWGSKPAIINGKVQTLSNTNKRTRNMNGITSDGRYIHAQSTNKYTEKTFATEVNKLVMNKYSTSIRYLFIQDAGGSTGEYSSISKIHTAGEMENNGKGRPVVTIVCMKRKSIPKITRNLKRGMQGDDVRILQTLLGGCEIDGTFGPGTEKQLKQAQKNYSLIADGICGPATRKALDI